VRFAGRVVLVVVTALVIVIFYAPIGHTDFAGNWLGGTYGVRMESAVNPRVQSVTPGSPAAQAGVCSGDILQIPPFSKTFTAFAYPRAGDRAAFMLKHADGSTYIANLTARQIPFTRGAQALGVIAMLPSTIFVVIAFVLVFLRPSVMTWSFYAYATGFLSTTPSFAYFTPYLPTGEYLVLSFLLSTVWGNFAVFPLLPFVLRFPDDKLTGFARSVDRAVWAAITVVFLAYAYEWYLRWSSGVPVWMGYALDTWLPLAVFATATFFMVKKYQHARAEIRQRFRFLIVGFVVSFIAYAIYFIPGVPPLVAQVAGYAVITMPICVMYAVLKHRVIDVNFVLNRALGYGILSILVIVFVSLLDYGAGHVIAQTRLATGVALVATIIVGVLLDRINRTVSNSVETVFFRERREAEEYLRRAARALPYATDEAAVSDGLAQVPVDALKLSAAALYRRSNDGERFEGVATASNTTVAPPGFDRNHLLVRMLQAGEERVWLDQLRGHLDREQAKHYVLAIPVTVRHELVSFVLYGPHRNGSQLDPEEVELLEELAREASRAYDHIEAVRIRERYAKSAAGN